MTDSHINTHFSGPGYITKVVHSLAGGVQKIASSRRHRKGRGTQIISAAGTIVADPKHENPWLRLWAPARLTWWVAILFTIGSALFSIGGYAITFPQNIPKAWVAGMTLDWVFFIGSLFFTSAACCQLLESINAQDSEGLYTEEQAPITFQWIAWHPKRIGYLASLVQLIGTVMFNFNTANAFFINHLNWIQQDLVIWTPNFIGCICFLIASRLAFMKVCHGYLGLATWKY